MNGKASKRVCKGKIKSEGRLAKKAYLESKKAKNENTVSVPKKKYKRIKKESKSPLCKCGNQRWKVKVKDKEWSCRNCGFIKKA